MVTIKDVARVAGVSVKTVSRVLSGNGYASEETRTKVERAAKKLGYVPNRIASGLASGRTMSIGMIVPNVSSPFYPLIVLGVEVTARKAGYHTILFNTANNTEREGEALQFMHQVRVDGVVVVSPRLPDNDLLLALSQHEAVVSIQRPLPIEIGASVNSANALGVGLAVDHLVKSKRKVIAFMAGPENAHSAQERLRGFIQAMKNQARSFSTELIVPYSANLEEGYRSLDALLESKKGSFAEWNEAVASLGRRGALQLLSTHPEVDGLICFDDQLAFGALKACAELGRRVPADIAIIGCNDLPFARQVTPTLTTQRVPSFEMGVSAAQLLIERINGRRDQAPVIFPHELVLRESAPAVT
jgi:LacI family transcriptional regulator